MLSRQNVVLQALLRAQRFLEENAAALSSFVDIATARKRLEDLIAAFTTQAEDQNASDRQVKGENAKQRQLREQLATDLMRPIAEIARRNLRSTPEFMSLKMPRHVTGAKYLAEAAGMLHAATIRKDTLIERGMPADFLEQFQSGLAQLKQSESDRGQSRAQRMGATKGLRSHEQDGRSILKVLDALVRRAFRDNATALGEWEGARAIRRLPVTATATPTPAPTNQTTTSTSPANTPANTPVTPATPSVATAA